MTRGSPAPRWPRWSTGAWLAPGAIIVVEEAAKAEIVAPAGLEAVDARVYGGTQVRLFVRAAK